MHQRSVGMPLVTSAAVGLLALACTNLSTPTPSGVCAQLGTYVIGDTVRDSLAAGDCVLLDNAYVDYYSFTLSGQAALQILLSSPRTGAVLYVYDSRSAIIANSAVGVSIIDTAASLRVILDSGTYRIAVHASTPGGSGPYRLVAVNDTAPVAGCGLVWVTHAITTTQTIRSTDCTNGPGGTGFLYHVYAIVLLRNENLDVAEHSTAFAPAMYLVGSSGASGSTVDSTGATADISFATPLQSAFQLWVGSSDQSAVGQYTLTIQ